MRNPTPLGYDHFRFPFYLPQERQKSALEQTRQLRRASNVIGISLIFQQVIAIVVSLAALTIYAAVYLLFLRRPLTSLDPNFLSSSSSPFALALYCLIYGSYMFIPFVLILFIEKRGPLQAVPFRRVREPGLIFPAVAVGLGVSVAGGYLSDYIQSIFRAIHLQASSPDFTPPSQPASFALYFFEICLLAPLLEELLFRGAILQSLRRFGDGFAIIASALLFGMIHGNLVQTPFAFLVGLALGFFVVELGSIWVSILMHFCINTLSVGLDLLSRYSGLGDAAVNILYLGAVGLLTLAGILILVKKRFFHRLKGNYSSPSLPMPYAFKTFCLTPSFLILVLVVAAETSFYLRIR